MRFSLFSRILVSFVVVLIISATTRSHPVPTADVVAQNNPPLHFETEVVPVQPTDPSRGLYSDFYEEKMQSKVSTASQVFAGEGAVTNIKIGGSVDNPDFGEKFTHTVLKTAVALADTGLQTAQDILKTVGGEIIEAIKF